MPHTRKQHRRGHNLSSETIDWGKKGWVLRIFNRILYENVLSERKKIIPEINVITVTTPATKKAIVPIVIPSTSYNQMP